MRSLAVLVCLALLAVAGVGATAGRAQDPGPTGPTGPAVVAAPTARPTPKPVRPRVTAVSVPGGQTGTSVVARGLRVRVRCSVLCGVRVRLYRGSSALGEGVAILRGRRGTAVVPVTGRRAKTLTRTRSARLELRVQATSADALDSAITRKSLTLKRG